jgi:hypothetical protein
MPDAPKMIAWFVAISVKVLLWIFLELGSCYLKVEVDCSSSRLHVVPEIIMSHEES